MTRAAFDGLDLFLIFLAFVLLALWVSAEIKSRDKDRIIATLRVRAIFAEDALARHLQRRQREIVGAIPRVAPDIRKAERREDHSGFVCRIVGHDFSDGKCRRCGITEHWT